MTKSALATTTQPSVPSRPSRILVVENDQNTMDAYARLLHLHGYEVHKALSAADGLREVEASPPDAIIVDLHMPDVNGLEFLQQLRARNQGSRVGIVTGDYLLDEGVATQLRELDAVVRFKPLWFEDLTSLIRELLTPAQ